ncbi:MAG: bifunctional folylpolyglutamate synthase/dihydrofolate synthase, partial [Bacteroidia bacterium]|nr:bifunctional folylpolyglutamate synthase/dihydrofolate synthase [Bacteroidia bacterium]
MNYSATLNYLYEQLPMFHRIGAAAYKADLDNTLAICKFLKHPEKKFKSVHVAGTNGKGSTSHMLAAVLQQCGYKTGLYTSPHLLDFRERIRVNGKMIPKKYIVDFVEEHKSKFEKIQPSFFEWTVGLAFDFFAKEKVDIAIIETGLGGRLDSTNVISPLVSVITNIGYDHMNLLGDTLEKIAGEKAGIIKKKTPVVISERQKEIQKVFIKKAKKENAEIIFAQDEFISFFHHLKNREAEICMVKKSNGDFDVFKLDLL